MVGRPPRHQLTPGGPAAVRLTHLIVAPADSGGHFSMPQRASSTTTAITRPNTSTARPRVQPVFLAASRPVDWAGAPVAACTLRVSSTTRLGSAFRLAFSHTCRRSRS